jgi:hypothetical protein
MKDTNPAAKATIIVGSTIFYFLIFFVLMLRNLSPLEQV